MAIMFNCATDWTLDIAWADADSVKALPLRRGVRCPKNYTDGQKFMTWLKTSAKFFEEDFRARNNGHAHSNCEGWVGDAWLQSISDCLSDYYKDTYNQRPHFLKQYFAMMCGLPTSADVSIRWDHLDKRAREAAKETREAMDKYAEERGWM